MSKQRYIDSKFKGDFGRKLRFLVFVLLTAAIEFMINFETKWKYMFTFYIHLDKIN